MSYDRSGSARKVAHWARSTVIDREGYAELEVDATVELIRSVVSAGVAAHRGVARRGSDRAGWRTLRPRPIQRRGGRKSPRCAGRT